VTDCDVWLNDNSSDSAVLKVLADYVAKNNGKLGNFSVLTPPCECCTYDANNPKFQLR